MTADQQGAQWSVEVKVFERSWVLLPGNQDLWPLHVQVGDAPVVVVARDDAPAPELKPGLYRIQGRFVWNRMLQQIMLPSEIGLLDLTIDGNPVLTPNWGIDGTLWLKRQQSGQADKDLLTTKVYRVIEGGIPMWLRS